MFRAIAITLTAAVALSAGMAQAGGGCSSKGQNYGGHHSGYNIGHVQHHVPHYEQRPHYVEQVYAKPCAKPVHVEPIYVQPKHVEHKYAKHVHVEPIYVAPRTYCYYKLCFKLPCWDYQKDMTFEDLDEAKQMAQMLQSNGYRIALLKYEDTQGGGKFQANHGRGEFEGTDYDRGQYEGSYGGQPRSQKSSNFEVLFRGEGEVPTQGRGQPSNEDFLLD